MASSTIRSQRPLRGLHWAPTPHARHRAPHSGRADAQRPWCSGHPLEKRQWPINVIAAGGRGWGGAGTATPAAAGGKVRLGEEGSGHWSPEETSLPPRGREVGPLGCLGRSPWAEQGQAWHAVGGRRSYRQRQGPRGAHVRRVTERGCSAAGWEPGGRQGG